jgi:hypothetical protein
MRTVLFRLTDKIPIEQGSHRLHDRGAVMYQSPALSHRCHNPTYSTFPTYAGH